MTLTELKKQGFTGLVLSDKTRTVCGYIRGVLKFKGDVICDNIRSLCMAVNEVLEKIVRLRFEPELLYMTKKQLTIFVILIFFTIPFLQSILKMFILENCIQTLWE